jgi:hypothetical protein
MLTGGNQIGCLWWEEDTSVTVMEGKAQNVGTDPWLG